MSKVIEIRRSQLITPYGIGSIVPMSDNLFYMVAGLDEWRYGENVSKYVIKEERLCKRLGVKALRLPPEHENKHAKIPAIRFPNNFYCPQCGLVKELQTFNEIPNCPTCRKQMIPDRFIIVCPNGHIDDFPIGEWIHKKCSMQWHKDTCKIKRHYGKMGSLASDITYICSCGASGHMAEAMGKGALARSRIKCIGNRPWLGNNREDCDSNPEDLRVTLRGSTNVWFAITRSSIYIPTETNNKIPDVEYEQLKKAHLQAGLNLVQLIQIFFQTMSEKYSCSVDTLVSEFEHRLAKDNLEQTSTDNSADEITEDEYRSFEYENLIKSGGSDGEEFYAIKKDLKQYSSLIQKSMKFITLVPKLRETRALVGFSRLEPKEDLRISEAKKMLYLEKQDWLPAISVYGEGIFFAFDTDKLNQWKSLQCVQERINKMDIAYHRNSLWRDSNGKLKAEFVLIHTFAHIMINQLSYECGYGSSALRERLYCEKDSDAYNMYGVLIYTASGDSEGTLGGLVSQGEARKLDDIVNAAIENARWCSSDPICIESTGQGTDSCNLAACHNCALLPETSCEIGNRLLDRGFLIGTPENPSLGFFNQ